MTWIYLKSEPRLWTVGYYDPNGKFIPESDHSTPQSAARRTAILNGANPSEVESDEQFARAYPD